MPFGVKSRGSCYQRLMGIVLKGLENICIAYLDDVIILGNTLTEHLANIEAILQRLREHNIKAEPSKCKFLLKETRHLGFIISEKGYRPDPDKVAAIKRYHRPKRSKRYDHSLEWQVSTAA